MEIKERIKKLLDALLQGVYERDSFLQIVFLSVLTNQPIYIFGRSGAGKSLLLRHVFQAFKSNKVLKIGKRSLTLPDKLDEFDIVHFNDFDAENEEIKKNIRIVFQEFIGKPIVVTGSFRPEYTLNEAKIIDKINIALSLPETLSPDALKNLLSSSFDENTFAVPEGLKISADEKRKWLSEINKVSISEDALNLIGLLSADCDTNSIYVSIRKWKGLLQILKAIAYCNNRSEVVLTDTFFLGMPIWSRARNNKIIQNNFFDKLKQILLKDIPPLENIDEFSAQLKQKAEHLLNANDDIYETEEFAGVSCVKFNVIVSGESIMLYVPETFIGTFETFNPYNELKQSEKSVKCNFNGTSVCSISIDTAVKRVGLRNTKALVNAGTSFEPFAKLSAPVKELASPEKQRENKKALESFEASLIQSVENYAQAMVRLKAIYKSLHSYTENPFFIAEYYTRLQGIIKKNFEQANEMIKILKKVNAFILESKK